MNRIAARTVVEPTIPAHVLKQATLTDDAGRPHSVAPKTVCAARPTKRRDTAWVELFDPTPTPLWRRVLGHRRMEVGAHGTLPWSALSVDKRDRYVRSTQRLFVRPPCVDDVKQRQGRSCSLAVVVVALLRGYPEVVQDLFEDHRDGTVTVKLHPHHVTVQKSVLRHGEGAVWWQLLQKAFAAQGWPHDGSHTQACPGGYCDTFMNMLTGKKAYAHEIDLKNFTYVRSLTDTMTPAEHDRKSHYSLVERFFAQSIEAKKNDGAVVCMSTKPKLPMTAWGIQPEHSYAVTGVRRRKNNNKERIEVQVYEPRGGYTRWLDLHAFVSVSIVLCFGEVR